VITRADADRSPEGSAGAFGGGFLNEGHLMLQHDLIEDDHGVATGPNGFARGGIWNGILFLEKPPHLTLGHTRVIGNTLRAARPSRRGRRHLHRLPGEARPQPDRPQPSRAVLRVQGGRVNSATRSE
jgi:hypothetical protein